MRKKHVGSGYLYRGHSDGAISASAVADGITVSGNLALSSGAGVDHYIGTGNSSSDAWGAGKDQRRTHQLSTGEYIWDMAGNVREKVDTDGNGSTLGYTGPASAGPIDLLSAAFSSLQASNKSIRRWIDLFNSICPSDFKYRQFE